MSAGKIFCAQRFKKIRGNIVPGTIFFHERGIVSEIDAQWSLESRFMKDYRTEEELYYAKSGRSGCSSLFGALRASEKDYSYNSIFISMHYYMSIRSVIY